MRRFFCFWANHWPITHPIKMITFALGSKIGFRLFVLPLSGKNTCHKFSVALNYQPDENFI